MYKNGISKYGLYLALRIAQDRYSNTAEMANVLIQLFHLHGGGGGTGDGGAALMKAFDQIDKNRTAFDNV